MIAAAGTLDYVTAAVVLVIAVMVACGSAAVTRAYAQVLTKAPRRSGLLLWHVVAVSLSVSGTWASLALGQLAILGWVESPRPLRLVLYAVFGLLTIVSLILIGCMQKRRVRPGHSEIIVQEKRDTHIDDD